MTGLRVVSSSVHGVQCRWWPADSRHYRAVAGVVGRHGLVILREVLRRSLPECVTGRHRHGTTDGTTDRATDVRLAGAVRAGAVVVVEADISGGGSGLSNLAGAHLLIFEQERGDDVGESESQGNDAGTNDDLRDLRRHAVLGVDATAEIT